MQLGTPCPLSILKRRYEDLRIFVATGFRLTASVNEIKTTFYWFRSILLSYQVRSIFFNSWPSGLRSLWPPQWPIFRSTAGVVTSVAKYTSMSVATKHWCFLMANIFSVFLGSKFQIFLLNSKMFPKLDAYASRIDFICNFNLLKTYIFPLHHEYQLRSDFGSAWGRSLGFDSRQPSLAVANACFQQKVYTF